MISNPEISLKCKTEGKDKVGSDERLSVGSTSTVVSSVGQVVKVI